MFFLTALVLAAAVCGGFTDVVNNEDARQKRLLFYDEEGNLVKTFGNSLHYLDRREDRNPLYWSFLNAFIRPLRVSIVFRPTILKETPIAYMIPVSDAVVEHINTDPVYQNKLFILSTKDPLVEKNALCEGKRTQIPSPNLCNKFLNCWDGWAFEQECPEGLMFSVNGYCDYAHQVDCQDRRVKETWDPQCSRDFQSYSNKANCNEFFVCVNRHPVTFRCPADLAYNERLGVCDFAPLVDCNSTIEASNPPPAVEVSIESTGTPAPIPTNSPTNEPAVAPTNPPAPATNPPVAATNPPVAAPNPPVAAPNPPAVNPPISFYPTVPHQPNSYNVYSKTEFNKESWTTTHIASSRLDAIRQLKLANLANVNVSQ